MARFARRHCGRAAQLEVRRGVTLLLQGTARDSFDGNTTSMDVALCRATADGLCARLDVPEQRLLAEVSFGDGSLHNVAQRKTWLGEAGTSVAGGGGVELEWREHSSTFGHWVYSGIASADGRSITGRFWLNVLPRKCGTFTLRACDPSTAAGPVPAPHSLAARVLLRWASKALEKKAAITEVLASAAQLG